MRSVSRTDIEISETQVSQGRHQLLSLPKKKWELDINQFSTQETLRVSQNKSMPQERMVDLEDPNSFK